MTELQKALEAELRSLGYQRDSVEQELRSDALNLERRIKGVLYKLDRDFHINSLGELQRTADDFDRNCARRQWIVEQQNRVRGTLERYGY